MLTQITRDDLIKLVAEKLDRLETLSPEIREPSLVLAALESRLKYDPCVGRIKFVSDRPKKNLEFALKIVKARAHNVNFISPEMQEALEHAPDDRRDKPDFILEAIALDRCELRDNQDFELRAVTINEDAFQGASDRLKADKTLVLNAVDLSNIHTILFYLHDDSSSFINNRKIVLKAAKHDRQAPEFASDELRGDRDFCTAAVEQNRYALKYTLGYKDTLSGPPEFYAMSQPQATLILMMR